MIMNKNQISHITKEEYRLKIPDRILIVPIGSTEQHAKHLPLGVDAIISENIAYRLAERINGLVAPTVNYGYKSLPTSGGGPLFPGTIDLNGTTFINLIKDIIVEFLDDGWQKIIILNGHFENKPFLVEAIDIIFRKQKKDFPKVLITDWYENISSELIPKIFNKIPFPGWELEHAAIVETSVMMFLKQELVHEEYILDEGIERVPTYYRFPPSKNLIPKSGCLHTARSSSSQKGSQIVENVLVNLEKIINKEFY